MLGSLTHFKETFVNNFKVNLEELIYLYTTTNEMERAIIKLEVEENKQTSVTSNYYQVICTIQVNLM